MLCRERDYTDLGERGREDAAALGNIRILMDRDVN